jgi:hypothetical protein
LSPTTRGSCALASSADNARRTPAARTARLGGVKTRRACPRQVGQLAPSPALAIGLLSSNRPQTVHVKTYTGIGQLVFAADPRSAETGPSLLGRTSKSKMAVGRYSEQQAFGMSTTPDTRPSIGAEPSSRYACSPE